MGKKVTVTITWGVYDKYVVDFLLDSKSNNSTYTLWNLIIKKKNGYTLIIPEFTNYSSVIHLSICICH